MNLSGCWEEWDRRVQNYLTGKLLSLSLSLSLSLVMILFSAGVDIWRYWQHLAEMLRIMTNKIGHVWLS